MSTCPQCEELPETQREGDLYLSPPLGHTQEQLTSLADQLELEYERLSSQLLRLDDLTGEQLESLAEVAEETLSRREQNDTESVLIPPSEEFGPSHLSAMKPLSEYFGAIRGDWLRNMVKEDRLETFFHPIVSCEDPRQVHGNECLLRGRNPDGELVNPGRIFKTARESGMMFYLDREARILSIRTAKDQGVEGKIFINFNPTSIYDPEYCLRTTSRAAKESGIDPNRIVFEVVESDEIDDKEQLTDIIQHYRDEGFQVALDDLGAGFNTLGLLHQLRPDYVKLDMGLAQDVDSDPYKSQISGKIMEMSQELDINTVVEGLETQAEWEWFRDRGADFAQGFLFAHPAAEPASPEHPVRS